MNMSPHGLSHLDNQGRSPCGGASVGRMAAGYSRQSDCSRWSSSSHTGILARRSAHVTVVRQQPLKYGQKRFQ